MSNSISTMDVDSPVGLKRSSSAPMINELNTTMTTASTTSSTRDSSPFNLFSSSPRPRRFSASYSPIHNATASTGPPRLTPRVSQLRQEECVDVAGREAAHEREIHSAMQISQSWEDLNLVTDSTTQCKPDSTDSGRRVGQRFYDQLHVNLPPYPVDCSSPSPTRSGFRQCFSPGLQMAFKSSLSPSPTRKAFTRRSQSPTITMRPSSLGPVKRKCELEDDQYLSPPAKRPNCYGVERGGLLMTHSNRLDATSSPLPGSLSSVGTPESLSSADSPGFTFRPVDSPSPGRPMVVADEPMQEERSLDLPKDDHVMASAEQSPS